MLQDDHPRYFKQDSYCLAMINKKQCAKPSYIFSVEYFVCAKNTQFIYAEIDDYDLVYNLDLLSELVDFLYTKI